MPWKYVKKSRNYVKRPEKENKDREKLIAKAKRGDEQAFNTYMQMNINLMHSMVSYYAARILGSMLTS